jgi:hypothetical protein
MVNTTRALESRGCQSPGGRAGLHHSARGSSLPLPRLTTHRNGRIALTASDKADKGGKMDNAQEKDQLDIASSNLAGIIIKVTRSSEVLSYNVTDLEKALREYAEAIIDRLRG